MAIKSNMGYIGLFFVILIVGVALGLVYENIGEEPNDMNPDEELLESDGIVAYTMLESPYLILSTGKYAEAPSGYVYVHAIYELYNKSYSEGISLNSFNFKLKADGLLFSHDIATYSSAKYNTDVDSVLPGGRAQSSVVFKVPVDTDLKGSVLVWDGYDEKIFMSDPIYTPGFPGYVEPEDTRTDYKAVIYSEVEHKGGTIVAKIHVKNLAYDSLTIRSLFYELTDGVYCRSPLIMNDANDVVVEIPMGEESIEVQYVYDASNWQHENDLWVEHALYGDDIKHTTSWEVFESY